MNLTRRGFLQAGALAAAGLAASPALAGRAADGRTAQSPCQGPVRPTAYGPVQGRQNGAGLVWYGVPYAAEPSGALRWQPPQDPAPWTAPLDCTAPAPMALQPCNGAAAGTEDCLKLDIYAPGGGSGLPVVVYFHGGGNRTGTTLELPGRRLAEQAGCVFVSVGYRLGLLGFNALPALQNGPDATGSCALLDAAKAFDWVEENIAAFGGDKNNITAMGFSSGGRDVLAMAASPYFAGRFQKAVSLSGGLTMADPARSARQTARILAPLAVEDGLFADADAAAAWLLTDGGEVGRWLYALDPARLCALLPGGGDLRMSSFPHLFADGVVLPAGGFEAVQNSAVPLLLVTGATEFSLFSPLASQYQAQGLSAADAARARDFANEYGSALYRLFNGAAAAQVLAPRSTAPVWLCELAYGAPGSRQPITALGLGSYHGLSLSLLSGENGMAALTGAGGPGFDALADAFTGAVAAFLRSGDPNGGALPAWHPWTPAAPAALVLDAGQDAASLIAELRAAPADTAAVLDRMEADASLPADVKQHVIRTVLNGRFFSAALDERYHNPSLWT